MNVYIVMEHYAYEGYAEPINTFDSMEKAEAERLELHAEYADRDIRIFEMAVL